MMKINVVNLVGNPCLLSPDKGVLLYNSINKELAEKEKIEVDFSGYEFLSSTFLNHSIGQICIDKDWDENIFNYHIGISGIDGDDLDDVALTLNNAQVRRRLKRQEISPVEYYSQRLSV